MMPSVLKRQATKSASYPYPRILKIRTLNPPHDHGPLIWLRPGLPGSIRASSCFGNLIPYSNLYSDLAGGGHESGHNECANITFAWMFQQCKHLLTFDPDYVRAAIVPYSGSQDAPPTTDNASDTNSVAQLRHAKVSPNDIEPHLGYAAGPVSNSFTGIFRLGGSTYRTPGQYLIDETERGDTNEFIHPSVRLRRAKLPDWKPPGLSGFDTMPDPKRPGSWVWSKTLKDGTVIEIPEYDIARKGGVSITSSATKGIDQLELSMLSDQDKAILAQETTPVDVTVVSGSVHVGRIWVTIKSLFGY